MAKGRIEREQFLDPEILKDLETFKGLMADSAEALSSFTKEMAEGNTQMKAGKATIEDLNNSADKLNKDLKESAAQQEKANKAKKEYTLAMAEATAKARDHRREIELQGKVNAATVGSVQRMRAEVALLDHQWSRATGTLKSKLEPQLTKLRNELKKTEAATGDARRNVGNYQSALQGLGGELQSQTGRVGQFVAALGKLGPIGAGIGAALTAIAAPAVAFFKLTEEGAEKLERGLANTKAAFSALGAEIARIGEKVIGGEAEKTGFGKFVSMVATLPTMLFSSVSPAFKRVTTEMSNAGEAASKFTEIMQQLEEDESAASVERSKTNLELAKAKLLYQELAEGDVRKVQALERVIELEESMAKIEQDLNITRRDALQERYDALILQGLTNEAEQVWFQLNEANVKVNDDLTSSLERQAAAQKKLNSARRQTAPGLLAMPQTGTSGTIGDIAANTGAMLAKQQAEDAIYWADQAFEEQADREKELREMKLQDIEDEKAARKEATQMAAESIQMLGDLDNAIFDSKIQRIEESGLSEEEKEKKIAKIKRKQAIWDKAQSIIQVGINTAIGITKAIPNALLMTFAAVQGAIQLAVVAAKKIPDIPQFFKGTHDSPGGPAWVGEKGRELVTFPSGEQMLTPNHATLAMLPAHTEVMPNDVLRAELAGMRYNRGYKEVKQDLQKEILFALTQIRDKENYDTGEYVIIRKGNTILRLRK